jgi:hypothetical protein
MKVENLTGTGMLWEGERLVGRVRYRIHATSPEDYSEPMGNSHGLLELVGAAPGTAFSSEPDADMLTLHLEDGRRWHCAITRSDGDAADVVGDGLIISIAPDAAHRRRRHIRERSNRPGLSLRAPACLTAPSGAVAL